MGALADASDEDRATGGIDLTRKIFPIVKFCSEQGMEDGSNEEMESAYLEILERRANGSGAARA